MNVMQSIVLALIAAAPLRAAEVDAVSFGPVTLRELALMPYAAERPLVHEQRYAAPTAVSWPLAIGATNVRTVTMTPGASAPPGVALEFSSSSATFPYPADASGAVGPHHVVDLFNNGIRAYDRKGNKLASAGLLTFWSGPRGADDVFDTRIAYDAGSDRWVAITACDRNYVNGGILIATSQSGDPAGTWNRYRISVTGGTADVDFPRLAITGNQIVITVNIWNSDVPSGAAILTIDRAIAYSGGASLKVDRYDAATMDLVPIEWRDPSDSKLRVARTFRNTGGIALTTVSNGFANEFNIDAPIPAYNEIFGLPIGSQRGTESKVLGGGDSIAYAVVRNRTLWSVTGVYPIGGPPRSSLVIWKIPIDTAFEATAFVIDDPTGTTSYAYGSIAVNKYGAALVGFAMFNASWYPTAGYVFIDSAGNMSAPARLRSGTQVYRNDRWGDYSSTVVDPVDDVGFWTLQEYSATTGADATPQWGTAWSYIPPPAHRRAARH